MPIPQPLDVTFAPEAKSEMLAFLGRVNDYPPTLTLMKGRVRGDSEDRWTYGAYAPKNIEAIAPQLQEHGYPLLYTIEELTVAIPQPQFISELIGKELALGPRALIVRER